VGFPSSGITQKDMLTSQCLDILRPLWNSSSTPNRHDPSMHHINEHNRPAVRSYNWHPSTRPPNSTKLEFTLYNLVSGLYSTMHLMSMQQCSRLSMKVSGSQASLMQKTMSACKMLLDYAATYPLAIIRYHASDMALNTNTDAAYLVLPKNT